MLTSLALIILIGLLLGSIFNKLRLPSLIGMLLAGIILGPFWLNMIDISILDISKELREIALIIILIRAGLNLDINDLKRVGRPAILLSFVPALFEIVGMMIVAPILLNISLIDAALMGTVIAAVSPAVIVPMMIKLIDKGYGTNKSIPQMIMAGASCDDIFVLVLFTVMTSMSASEVIAISALTKIPISITLGILVGLVTGLILNYILNKISTKTTTKTIVILAIAFIIVSLEKQMTGIVSYSGLLATMVMAMVIRFKNHNSSVKLAEKFSKLWSVAEVILFVLVGATLNIEYALDAGVIIVWLIILVMIFRIVGVIICLLKTKLNYKERIFTTISYMPKATVQAAIGGIPLAMGLSSGELILTVAVLSILITAPLGAILMNSLYKRLLNKQS